MHSNANRSLARLVLALSMTAAALPVIAEATPYRTPVGEADNTYTVTVGDANVPVVKMWKNRIRMARLAISGKTTIAVSTGEQSIGGYEIRPAWAKVDAKVDGGKLLLTLEKPCDLRVKINKSPALALFAYPEFKEPEADDVHSLADEKGVDATGKTDMVEVLQKAVDRIAESGGGTLYVPAGVYGGSKKSTLKLRSKVNLHLAPEAVIRQIRFLLDDVEDAQFTGQGILDFTGAPGTNQQGCLRGNGCRKVLIDGLISLNFDYNWNTRFDRSRDVTIRNYRVFGGKDGIDPVDSQKISIRNVYIVTSDDCIATKSFRGGAEEVSDITAEYCLLRCLKYGGVKIGTETNAKRFRNITYRNIEVVSAMRVAIIQLRDGAEISDVTLENITAGLGWQRAIDFVIQKRRGLGTIHDVTVRNVNIWNVGDREAPRMEGYDGDHRITDVTFDGLILEGRPIDTAKASGFTMANTDDIRFVLPKTFGRRIEDLADMVTARSEDWKSPADGGMAALLDGKTQTVGGVRNRPGAWLELDLGKARKLAGLRINGRGRGNALGVSLMVPDGDGWKTLVDRRLVAGDGWVEARIDPVEASKARIVLHGMPENSHCTAGELELLEEVSLRRSKE